MTTTPTTEVISDAQTTEEKFLRQIMVRSQMKSFAADPLIMSRADGVHYWDVNGKQYLDGLSGIYVVSVGHNNRRVIEAIKQQFDTMTFSPVMHGTNPLAVQLANKLVEVAPDDMGAAKFFSGGSETTEAAIKMARQYHRLKGNASKFKIIGRYHSWHCLLYTSPSPRDGLLSRMPSSA